MSAKRILKLNDRSVAKLNHVSLISVCENQQRITMGSYTSITLFSMFTRTKLEKDILQIYKRIWLTHGDLPTGAPGVPLSPVGPLSPLVP